jgi:chorismate-pyruvate lyase
MRVSSEELLRKILDAPVGQVVTVLGENLDCRIKLEVIEQSTVAPNQFVRDVYITAQGWPVIKANVRFDSTVLPDFIMAELLKKKRGIGTILNVNGIKTTRNIITVNCSPDKKKASRKYEIVHDGKIWFTISEEIRLGNFGSDNNG